MSIGKAFKAFFAILGDSSKGEAFEQACAGKLISPETLSKAEGSAQENLQSAQTWKKEAEEVKSQLETAKAMIKKHEEKKPDSGKEAVITLSLLQRQGRLIDFLQEDISSYEDEQIGAAVRQIHAGCRKVLQEHFSIQAICKDGAEGDDVKVPADADPAAWSLSGNVSGDGPFKGQLVHKGWRAGDIRLPERNESVDWKVLCPAEVEV